MPLDRSAILRTAHARARALRKRFYWRSYRQILADEMRRAWAQAKAVARHQTSEVQRAVLTDEQRAHVRDMMAAAWMQPITRAGNMRHVAMMSAAIAEVRT